MSFILEALRKSEQERQRHQTPGMADLRARNRVSGRRYWLPLVIFLIGINIGLLLFLWLNGTPPPAAEVAPDRAAEAATAPVDPSPPTAETAVQASTAAAGENADSAPAVSAMPDPAETGTPVQDPPPRSLSSQLAPNTAARTAPVKAAAELSGASAPQSSYGNLPTLEELTLAGSISLDPMRIDMHVFSPQPAERFVFINMNKYREGDSLREGPVLTTITPDGVILNYQGRTFLVTRE
jgi:general secretion pathway protein B